MEENEYREVMNNVDAIIKKMGNAIGREFSSRGCSALFDEVQSLRNKIDGIIKKNKEDTDDKH